MNESPLELMTRIKWMTNFEGVATLGNHEDALFIPVRPRMPPAR